MNIEEAFENIAAKLNAGKDAGIVPSIRVSGPDWVCTIEDEQTKFIIIAKEEGLMLVSMKSRENAPEVQRIQAPEHTQQSLVNRIQETIREIYGALPTK